MAYEEGFVVAVPNTKKQAYIEHATLAAKEFMEHGAQQVVDCRG